MTDKTAPMRPPLVAKTAVAGPSMSAAFMNEDHLVLVLSYREAVWLKRTLMAGIARMYEKEPTLERREFEARNFAINLRHQLDLFGVPR